jgi:hypothetical protein
MANAFLEKHVDPWPSGKAYRMCTLLTVLAVLIWTKATIEFIWFHFYGQGAMQRCHNVMYTENSIMKEGVKWKVASNQNRKSAVHPNMMLNQAASLFLDERTTPTRPGWTTNSCSSARTFPWFSILIVQLSVHVIW